MLTGAGVSAESGLPTFREAQTGLWAQYDPEELATPQAFRRNPRLVWEWYAWRRQLAAAAQPNPAHVALAALAQRVPECTLITQNVDGLHTRAGSVNPIELHGNLSRVKCFDDGRVVEHWQATADPPPRCPDCGGMLRPDVVWFGELLPRTALDAAIAAAQACDVFLSIGTSGLVEPAAALPRIALQCGATVVLINLDVPTRATPPLYAINAKAGELLPALVDAVWPTPDSIGGCCDTVTR
ncbi:NAD-dependent deacylase [Candidatus Gracilibacteria bacterium]|nr:NAD-dependent deacylase [Candidatus Gracilibacteria bacterium]